MDKSEAVVYRKGFCLLTLKLLQSPDLSLSELMALLQSDKYTIHSGFLKNHFIKALQDLNDIGTDYLLDVIHNLNQLMQSADNDTTIDTFKPSISRISVAGRDNKKISRCVYIFFQVTFVGDFY